MKESNIILLLDLKEDTFDARTIDISVCKKSVFLVGCYRTKDKNQLEWITGENPHRSVALYNVRSEKSRDGWVNANNPKIKDPDIAILYDFEDTNHYTAFKIKESREMTEQEMNEMANR